MDAANRASYPKTGTTVTDTINISNTGSMGGATFQNINNGVFNFDGADDYIDLGSDTLNLGSGDFTINAWAYSNSLVNYARIINKHAGSFNTDTGYALYADASTKNLTFVMKPSGGSRMDLSSGVSINNIGWFNASVTKNSSTTIIYLNGIARNNISTSAGSVDSSNSAFIGKFSNSGTFAPWDGNIGNFQAYNRALSASEVLFNYNGLKSRFGL
jgi:hypothetical protein